MMTFNTIRALSLRVGDMVPMPLPSGGWDRSQAVRVVDVSRADGMKMFTLEGGKSFRAFPMNRIPFIAGR